MRTFTIITFLMLTSKVSLLAQKDTLYLNSKGEKVGNKALANSYNVVTKKNTFEISETFDMSGKKQSFYMFKKLPVDNSLSGNEKQAKKQKEKPDSAMVKHGNFSEWFESGSIKARGSYFADQLHGTLETFHPNGKSKRHDEYSRDSLKSGRCFDSLGTEIAYFPFKVQPEYPGGEGAIFKYLANNTHYSAKARERGIQGVVHVKFVVGKDGNVTDVGIKKGVHTLLDEESIRVVSLMPKWTAGKIDGENVKVT
jgi:TonB family protein